MWPIIILILNTKSCEVAFPSILVRLFARLFIYSGRRIMETSPKATSRCKWSSIYLPCTNFASFYLFC